LNVNIVIETPHELFHQSIVAGVFIEQKQFQYTWSFVEGTAGLALQHIQPVLNLLAIACSCYCAFLVAAALLFVSHRCAACLLAAIWQPSASLRSESKRIVVRANPK
jgi:hypothetical protein